MPKNLQETNSNRTTNQKMLIEYHKIKMTEINIHFQKYPLVLMDQLYLSNCQNSHQQFFCNIQ